MLTHSDRRFFDEETEQRLKRFLDARSLLGDELLALADESAASGGLDPQQADRFLDLATAAFELSREPVDHDWYFTLEKISAVAADIGGVPSTHMNHLTPRGSRHRRSLRADGGAGYLDDRRDPGTAPMVAAASFLDVVQGAGGTAHLSSCRWRSAHRISARTLRRGRAAGNCTDHEGA